MDQLLHEKLDLIAAALDAYRVDAVGAVLRRQWIGEDGEERNAVDFYPVWNSQGTYGSKRLLVEYMDHDWQRERFNKFTGLNFNTLPIEFRETAVSRRFGHTHTCEVEVTNGVKIMYIPADQDKGRDRNRLHRYIPGRPRQQTRPPQTAVTPPPTPPQAPNPQRANDVTMFSNKTKAIEAPAYDRFMLYLRDHLVEHGYDKAKSEGVLETAVGMDKGWKFSPDDRESRERMVDAVEAYFKSRLAGNPHPVALSGYTRILENGKVS